MLNIALITNHPPPFRIPIYERIAKIPDVNLHLIFCSRREPNRQWKLPPLNFKHTFLHERFVTRGDNFIHNNIDVISTLRRLAPDVIVTTGFNPTYLYAFAYAVARGVPHVPMTDGTNVSEEALSTWHKAVRRLVYARSRAFIAASRGGLKLYESYGISPDRCFLSCLCIDNEAYRASEGNVEKRFDFIFCGRIVEDKNPLFALDVAHDVSLRLGRKVSILFVGHGEQEAEVKAEAAKRSETLHVEFNGFASQEQLPALYRSARIFLFPTRRDVWGVVANEACAAGLPIIVSPYAGVIDELVVNGQNGFVCELNVSAWSERATMLLTHPDVMERFEQSSLALVGKYTFDHAAAGVVDACRLAVRSGRNEHYDAKIGRKAG
ncbi:MAG TPA: glycosyltransferase family 4 protein [Noviherbaspirillum sp.]|jgi:glycosyltransferase involved in cell wall biosynthesis|uniref:glycosyltransferase family 4 protein n=1 Tax=Noviherbaspirillum sp. TaxID=1926288 RepID=UPI002DDCE0F9|nr:glycosyltransferase family 4 protein [Noviherbaspirillum sp.]HEV2613004.1 glycosyltransferase family 4 protein [Noviherbaspirillum sp.]